jgi:hypothetical protein
MTSQNIVSNSENDEWQLINTHPIKFVFGGKLLFGGK